MRKIHFTLAGTKQKSRVVAKAIIDVTQNHDICFVFLARSEEGQVVHCDTLCKCTEYTVFNHVIFLKNRNTKHLISISLLG